MNFNDMHEDVLFKKEVKNDLVEEFSFDDDVSSDVNEEVLFKNSPAEELDFLEPTKDVGYDVVFKESELEPLFNAHEDAPLSSDIEEETLFGGANTSNHVEELSSYEVVEENINFSEPTKDDVSEEVLFTEPEETSNFEVVEENINFAEPSSSEAVSEEVLFTPQAEEVPLEDLGGESAIPDDLSSLGGVEEATLFDTVKPVYIERNFARKMLDSDPIIIERYQELKNYILTFKKVKSRVSNDFDSFNMGRTQLFKLGVSQKSLKLYLNLDFETVESRLKCKYAGDKKAYASVPVFLRIKSDRAMRNAKYLIEKVAARFELSQNLKATAVDAVDILTSKAKSYE
ncbi:MAG: hypothetical protein IKL82_02895 [Clostridia bacterium]|nr:hypothetical protein [Clostridia bacterium]